MKTDRTDLTAVLLGTSKHCAQLLCGLKLLQDAEPEKYAFTIEDRRKDAKYNPFQNIRNVSFLLMKYRGKKVIFDMNDGYHYLNQIQFYLKEADFYFKRSFSREKNYKLLGDFCSVPSQVGSIPQIDKMKPLGFNYFVTYPNNPLNRSVLIQLARWFQGLRRNDSFFTPEVFERDRKLEVTESPKILFYARLWQPRASKSDDEWNNQVERINATRCGVIRALREKYKDRFIGGIQKSKFAMEYAPDLIASSKETERSRYLRLMKSSDICIGSTGLHDSIGGKMGEYVACAKAIVAEKLLYEVTGDFAEGKNYLSFDGIEDCLAKVDFLVNNPQLVYEMKLANKKYYDEYLKPDVLVRNALNVVDRSLDQNN